MAEYLIQDTTLTSIGDALRSKLGTNSYFTPAEMVTAINSISSGGGGATIDEWVGGTTYNVGDIVTYEGAYYICTATVGGLDYPQTNSSYWELLNADEFPSYKGEYYIGTPYIVGDIVTYEGNVYRCLAYNNESYAPPNYLGMYWEQLNTASSSSGLSRQTIPAGTYTLQAVYPSSYSLHPYLFTISEKISGTYTDVYAGNGGVYDTIEISGHDGSNEMPVSTLNLKSGSTTVNGWDGYYMSNGYVSLTIASDTQVSSLFYDVFMGLTTY